MNPEKLSTPKFLENIYKKNRIILLTAVLLLIFIPLGFFIFSNFNTNPDLKKTQDKKVLIYPGAPYVGDQIIVRLKDEYTLEELTRLKEKLDDIGVISQEKVFDSDDPNLKNFYLLKLKAGSDVKKTLESLAGFEEIEQAGPNYIVATQEIPNDQLFAGQWDMQKINMPSTWDLTHGSSNIKVAVVDSGVNYAHPDLAGRVTNGRDFSRCSTVVNHSECVEKERDNDSNDDFGHGTHVAGTIGAITNNNIGVAGIGWNVSILAIKAVGSTGEGIMTDITDGIRYAADSGAKVINLSLGSPAPCNEGNFLAYQEAINYATSKGAIVVAAAGNDNKDAGNVTPASCNGVITVGATTADDTRSSYSNFGSIVDIAAPGGQKPCTQATCITSTWLSTQYTSITGTSMATPHVAGVVALLLSSAPGLSQGQVRECLVNNGDAISTDKYIGGKRLNAAKTIEACGSIKTTPTATPTLTPITLTPGQTIQPPTATGIQPVTSNITTTPFATATKKPTPTPPQTYTCREKSGGSTPAGTIQIGNLECIPN